MNDLKIENYSAVKKRKKCKLLNVTKCKTMLKNADIFLQKPSINVNYF